MAEILLTVEAPELLGPAKRKLKAAGASSSAELRSACAATFSLPPDTFNICYLSAEAGTWVELDEGADWEEFLADAGEKKQLQLVPAMRKAQPGKRMRPATAGRIRPRDAQPAVAREPMFVATVEGLVGGVKRKFKAPLSAVFSLGSLSEALGERFNVSPADFTIVYFDTDVEAFVAVDDWEEFVVQGGTHQLRLLPRQQPMPNTNATSSGDGASAPRRRPQTAGAMRRPRTASAMALSHGGGGDRKRFLDPGWDWQPRLVSTNTSGLYRGKLEQVAPLVGAGEAMEAADFGASANSTGGPPAVRANTNVHAVSFKPKAVPNFDLLHATWDLSLSKAKQRAADECADKHASWDCSNNPTLYKTLKMGGVHPTADECNPLSDNTTREMMKWSAGVNERASVRKQSGGVVLSTGLCQIELRPFVPPPPKPRVARPEVPTSTAPFDDFDWFQPHVPERHRAGVFANKDQLIMCTVKEAAHLWEGADSRMPVLEAVEEQEQKEGEKVAAEGNEAGEGESAAGDEEADAASAAIISHGTTRWDVQGSAVALCFSAALDAAVLPPLEYVGPMRHATATASADLAQGARHWFAMRASTVLMVEVGLVLAEQASSLSAADLSTRRMSDWDLSGQPFTAVCLCPREHSIIVVDGEGKRTIPLPWKGAFAEGDALGVLYDGFDGTVSFYCNDERIAEHSTDEGLGVAEVARACATVTSPSGARSDAWVELVDAQPGRCGTPVLALPTPVSGSWEAEVCVRVGAQGGVAAGLCVLDSVNDTPDMFVQFGRGEFARGATGGVAGFERLNGVRSKPDDLRDLYTTFTDKSVSFDTAWAALKIARNAFGVYTAWARGLKTPTRAASHDRRYFELGERVQLLPLVPSRYGTVVRTHTRLRHGALQLDGTFDVQVEGGGRQRVHYGSMRRAEHTLAGSTAPDDVQPWVLLGSAPSPKAKFVALIMRSSVQRESFAYLQCFKLTDLNPGLNYQVSLCKPKRNKSEPTRYPALFHSTPDGPIFKPKSKTLYTSFKQDGVHISAVREMARPRPKGFRAHPIPNFDRCAMRFLKLLAAPPTDPRPHLP